MQLNLPLVAVTMGDPVGVGPEIIPKALSNPRVLRCCRTVIYGDAARLRAGMRSTGRHISIQEIPSINHAHVGQDGLTVIDPAAMNTGSLEWGKPTAASAMAMVAYLNAAITMAAVQARWLNRK